MASKILLASVFVLELIAFALAAAAEHQRSTATVNNDGTFQFCTYTSKIATGLGVVSLLFLIAAQVVIMVATKCLCCGKALQPGRNRVWAIVLFVFSCFTFFIAAVCLLAGSVQNARRTRTKPTFLSEPAPECEILRKGIFAAGAAFTFFTGILSSFFYVNYSRADKDYPPQSRDPGITMGRL